MRRLSRRRSAGPEGTEPPAAAAPGPADAPTPTPADAEGRTSLLADPAASTQIIPGAAPVVPDAGAPRAPLAGPVAAPPEPGLPAGDLPAGLDPDELAAVPTTSARRSRLRRRVAFLRAARELLLRDLGGFVYELHRTAGDVEHEAHRRLREAKLARLSAVDAELHELELRLDDVRRHVVVREPGVGGECPQCGELFGSDAHYCSHCGLALTESARKALAGAPAPEGSAATRDQSTQELPPPEPEAGTEFRWPRRRRGAEANDETMAAGAGAVGAGGAIGDPVAPGGDTPGGGGDAAPRGDAVAGGDDAAPIAGRDDAAARGDTIAGEDDAPGGDAVEGGADAAPRDGTIAGGGDVAPGGDATAGRGDSAPGGDAVAGRDDAAPRGDTVGDGGDAAPGGDSLAGGRDDIAASADEVTSGDDAAARGGTTGTHDSSQPDESRTQDGPNGRAPDVVSRLERGS